MIPRFASLLLVAGALACSSEVAPLSGCEPRGDAEPLCGFHNPEDLAPLPSGSALLVSEYGGMERNEPGALARLDLADDTRVRLFRGDDAQGQRATPGWGDASCPGPPVALSPHGIDLVERADGRFALLVVNHGGRESVEWFEVLDPRGEATLAWRGCALAPEAGWLNDVVGHADGRVWVSHMMPRRDGAAQLWEFAKTAVLGRETGRALAWSPDAGFGVVPGSQTRFANGVEVSPDGTVLFVNSSLGGHVRGIELATGRMLGEAPVASPDNSTWAPDGRLLVASLTGSILDLRACDAIEHGACPASFEIVALDPETFATEVVYRSDGVTMGAGTVGLQLGDALYIGTFAGVRILRVRGGGGSDGRGGDGEAGS